MRCKGNKESVTAASCFSGEGEEKRGFGEVERGFLYQI